jgi:hypothetical protein
MLVEEINSRKDMYPILKTFESEGKLKKYLEIYIRKTHEGLVFRKGIGKDD